MTLILVSSIEMTVTLVDFQKLSLEKYGWPFKCSTISRRALRTVFLLSLNQADDIVRQIMNVIIRMRCLNYFLFS